MFVSTRNGDKEALRSKKKQIFLLQLLIVSGLDLDRFHDQPLGFGLWFFRSSALRMALVFGLQRLVFRYQLCQDWLSMKVKPQVLELLFLLGIRSGWRQSR